MEDDIRLLKEEKPDWTEADVKRVKGGEPLAYVIGNVPFLGLTIDLASKPLIPRPETEWWTEALIERIGAQKLRVLDLCAGSGAIGLAILAHCPGTEVAFGEIDKRHREQIRKNAELNKIDLARASIRSGSLFEPFKDERFDMIAANPPYIPDRRELDESVTEFEPAEALYAGADGLGVIREIIAAAPAHMNPGGELWMECDIENIEEAERLLGERRSEIRNDQYGRPRLLVAYY